MRGQSLGARRPNPPPGAFTRALAAAEARSASCAEAPPVSVAAHFRINRARMGDTLTVQSTSEITDFNSCRFVEGDQRPISTIL